MIVGLSHAINSIENATPLSITPLSQSISSFILFLFSWLFVCFVQRAGVRFTSAVTKPHTLTRARATARFLFQFHCIRSHIVSDIYCAGRTNELCLACLMAETNNGESVVAFSTKIFFNGQTARRRKFISQLPFLLRPATAKHCGAHHSMEIQCN